MTKFGFYLDKEKETKWLNELADNGMKLKHFFAGFYTFEPCEPGMYEYQIDFIDGFFRVKEDYREIMEDTGIEILQVWGPWAFLCREKRTEPFEIYTDIESTIQHYQKILRMLKFGTVLECICFLFEIPGIMAGNKIIIACACIMVGIILAFARASVKTSKRLAWMKERGTIPRTKEENQEVEEWKGYGSISPVLCVGFICNGVNYMLKNSVPEQLYHFTRIMAILIIAVGFLDTFLKRRK